MTVLDDMDDEAVYDASFDPEFDDGSDDEAVWRPRAIGGARLVLPKARPGPPRPANRPVTQAQLQMAVNRIDGYINRNNAAIKRVNASVASLTRDVRRQGKEVSSTRDAIVLLPMLSGLFKDDPTLAALFPLMMVGGLGGPGSTPGGLLSGGNNLMPFALMLALKDKP